MKDTTPATLGKSQPTPNSQFHFNRRTAIPLRALIGLLIHLSLVMSLPLTSSPGRHHNIDLLMMVDDLDRCLLRMTANLHMGVRIQNRSRAGVNPQGPTPAILLKPPNIRKTIVVVPSTICLQRDQNRIQCRRLSLTTEMGLLNILPHTTTPHQATMLKQRRKPRSFTQLRRVRCPASLIRLRGREC